MMILCEECGKKYQIDTAKIKGETARFKCKSCQHIITVKRSEEQPAAPPPPPPPPPPARGPAVPPAGERPPASRVAEPDVKDGRMKPGKPKKTDLPSRRLGLRIKMFFFFFAVPLIFIGASGLFYLWQLKVLSKGLTTESAEMVSRMAEEIIAEKARAVASQCRIYMMTHPDLMKQEFQEHPDFQKIGVQKVGKTGYTALYEMPDPDGIWRTWLHVNPGIVAIDMSSLKQSLGGNFSSFWKVFTGVQGGKESRGAYVWQDKDGSIRDKYMVCTRIEGTPFVVASTTYLDEFTKPMMLVESQAENRTQTTRTILFFILGATIAVIGGIVFFYGHALTGRIKSLTEVADRISVGELDAQIHIRSGDEIGGLGDAISRMQESIRLSIERLRKRR